MYDYTVVGAGICGCSVVHELTTRTSSKVLLIDKLENIACGASGAAGAFLSPLLGKPNEFKNLVTSALKYTNKLYRTKFPNIISNCGTLRIPKDNNDREKFKSYEPYMDFPYENKENGFFFNIGSVVNSVGTCKMMTTSFNLETKFNYEVLNIKYNENEDFWLINDEIKTKKLILTTGASVDLIDEFYIKIRPVWGNRIDIETSTKLEHNYHKECSISKSFQIKDGLFKVSIGATHNRDLEDALKTKENNEELLKKAADIVSLEDIKITKEYIGARACSVDYFPMLGEIIDSKKTLEEFPYMVDGTHVNSSRFTKYKNLFILNGVGGRGFVLAPYLSNMLVSNILENKEIIEDVKVDRLFIRETKRLKNG